MLAGGMRMRSERETELKQINDRLDRIERKIETLQLDIRTLRAGNHGRFDEISITIGQQILPLLKDLKHGK